MFMEDLLCTGAGDTAEKDMDMICPTDPYIPERTVS